MSKITRISLFIFFLLALTTPVFAQEAPRAQEAEYRVQTRRDFGYGNGSDVRGNFSLTIYGNAENIQSVTYRLDDTDMATVAEPPYKFSFNTSSYPAGQHAISAVVRTKDGREVTTPNVRLNFLSVDQQNQSFQKILFPLLGIIFGVMIIGVAAQFFMFRRDPSRLIPGAPRSYGLKGGTICPRCKRAYGIHFWSINLIGGALDRCDYCGKWAVVRSRPRAELDAAVQAEMNAANASETSLPGVEAQSEEEKLSKLLDESKYSE